MITEEQYAIAASNGIKRKTAYSRIHALGWDVERAVTESAKKPFLLNDRQLEIAASNGISKEVAYRRMKYNNWSAEDAITRPVRHCFTREEMAIATGNGISLKTAFERFKNQGWTLQDAITKPIKRKKEEPKGKIRLSKEEIAIATEHGVSKKLACARIRYQNWDREKAIRIPPKNGKSEYAVYKGEELLVIGTAKECGEELGLSPKTIHYYASKAYREKLSRWKNKGLNAKIAVLLDGEEE